MVIGPYDPCTCGSGKKYKWCCQALNQELDQATHQADLGQFDNALKMIEAIAAKHADKPEPWGRKALILFEQGKRDEAEAALDKALVVNPTYPAAYLLRGMMRLAEGETEGALVLFRKAAEYFAPSANQFLAQVYTNIFNCEIKSQRPVAARAAIERAISESPNTLELQEYLNEFFGSESPFPEAARKAYSFLSPSTPGDRRPAWNQALSQAADKFPDAVAAFEKLATDDPHDAAAWYNLALARAWIGCNKDAIEALDHYVALEPDEAKAGAAWALAEALRYGKGMEEHADHLTYTQIFQFRDIERLNKVFAELHDRQSFVLFSQDSEQNVVRGLLLGDSEGLITPGAGRQPKPVVGNILIASSYITFFGTNRDALDRWIAAFQARAQSTVTPVHSSTEVSSYGDLVLEAMVLPVGESNKEEGEIQIKENARKFYEDQWIHRPLRALSGVTPLDAAGHGIWRKKLRGVIDFLEQCAQNTSIHLYSFDGLRHKLGLLERPSPGQESKDKDLAAYGVAELAGLSIADLTDEQLEVATLTAQKLDAHDLGRRFAQALLARPPISGKGDRMPFYAYLIQKSLEEGAPDKALEYVDQGEKEDCEHNGGVRRNDYELRRAQVLAKQGEKDQAADVFERLIARVPDHTPYRGAAAEAMLALKEPARALRFAEGGLAQARKRQDRDSESYLMELVAAAKKQGA